MWWLRQHFSLAKLFSCPYVESCRWQFHNGSCSSKIARTLCLHKRSFWKKLLWADHREIIVFHCLGHVLACPIWKQTQNTEQRGNNSHVLEDEADLLGDLEKDYRLRFLKSGPKGGKTWGENNEMNMSKQHLDRLEPGTKIKCVVIKTWKVNKMNGCLNGDIKETTLDTWYNF